jgi:hypothetical protein
MVGRTRFSAKTGKPDGSGSGNLFRGVLDGTRPKAHRNRGGGRLAEVSGFGNNTYNRPGSSSFRVSLRDISKAAYYRDYRKCPVLWKRDKLPVQVKSLVLTREALFIAGPPDKVDPADPWDALEGKRAGLLWALSLRDGETVKEIKLPCSSVYDGMAAAGGRLYVSCVDGKLRCFGTK